MSAVNSDHFGSLTAFASQLILVLHGNLIPSHDCLNQVGSIGGAPESQRLRP